MGVLILAWDFNSRVGESKDYVEYEILAYHMLNNITACLSYDKDYTWSRRSEDKQVVNYLNYVEPLVADYVMAGFPRTLVAYIGSRVIDYVWVDKDNLDATESVTVRDQAKYITMMGPVQTSMGQWLFFIKEKQGTKTF